MKDSIHLRALLGVASTTTMLLTLGGPGRLTTEGKAQPASSQLTIVSVHTWNSAVETFATELVVRSDGEVPTDPGTLVLAGPDCSVQGPSRPMTLTSPVPALAPGTVWGALWDLTPACEHYQAGFQGGPMVAVPRSSTSAYLGPYAESTAFGDASNWAPPYGGNSSTSTFHSFSFTTASPTNAQAQSGVVWRFGNANAGTYRLYAYLPQHSALNGLSKRDASQAAYLVRDYAGEWDSLTTLDQETFSDTWAFLGRTDLPASAELMLADNAAAPGDPPSWVTFSAALALPD